MTEVTFNDIITNTMHPSYAEVACKDMQNSATDLPEKIFDGYTEDKYVVLRILMVLRSVHGFWLVIKS